MKYLSTAHNYHRLMKIVLILLSFPWLLSCAVIAEFNTPGAGNAGNKTISLSPLEYFIWLKSASAEELVIEKIRLDNEKQTGDSAVNTIQLALLLSVPWASTEATERDAMELIVVELARDNSSAEAKQQEYQTLAGIWFVLLENRKALREAEASQQSDQAELEVLHEKVGQLEKQIEGLTSIEQNLIEREQLQGQP